MRNVAFAVILVFSSCEGTIGSSYELGKNPNNVNNANANVNNENNDNNANNANVNNLNNSDGDVGMNDGGITCPSVACGEMVFDSACAVCHGPAATGVAVQWPGSIAGFDDVAPIVRAGRGDMPALAVDVLDDESVTSIQLYLDSLADPDETQWTADEVYFRKCAGCHGVDGEGHARGYQLRQPIDGYFEYITQYGVNRQEFATEMPAYANITQAQYDGMKAKLRAYPIDRSGQGLYDLYCANCHGLDASGGAISQGLLYVKMFPSTAMTNDTRSGFFLGEYGNLAFMEAYGPAFFTDAEIESMTIYIQNNL